MPLRHGVEVHVTNTDLEPLIEYGSQTLGNSATLSKIVSTRIEAKDGLQFYIHIRTEFPFPLKEEDLVDSETPAASAFSFDPNVRGFRDPYLLRHAKRWVDNTHIEEQEDIENQTDKHDVNTGTSASTRTRAAPTEELPNILAPLATKPPASSKVPSREHAITRSTSDYQVESIQETELPAYPPFDLTASVYIDGHEKPECRQVIYLNPNHHKFYSGGFIFKGRWVSPPPPAITDDQAAPPDAENSGTANSANSADSTSKSENAHISIRNWVFQSVPISMDSLTDRFMTVCSTEKSNEATSAASQSEADRLLNDLTSTLSSNNDMLSATHRPKPGQIEVHIRRIVTGTPTSKIPFKAYHYAGANESVGPLTTPTGARNEEDPTYTTSLRTQVDAATGQEAKMKLNTVPWRSYRKNEEVYAKFLFNYSSRPKLVNLGLCGEMGTPTVATARVGVPDMWTSFARKRVAGRSRRDDENSENDEEYSMTSKTKQAFGQTRTSVPQIDTGRITRSAKRRLSDQRVGEPMQTRQPQNTVDFRLPEENKENKEAWRQQDGLSSDEDDN